MMPTKKDKDRFPADLLSKSSIERKLYFDKKRVAHPLLVKAHDELISGIYDSGGAQLIFVFGPPGVGKTTLIEGVQKQLRRDARERLEENPGLMVSAVLEAKSPEGGTYEWKDDYTRALLILHEPLLSHKIDYRQYGIRHDSNGKLLISPTVTTAALRRSLEATLIHRQLLVFFRDEAQHITKVASGRRLLDHLDTIKSLASTTRTLHALVGNYELLKLPDLSGQLSRRSIDVHLPRYRYDNKRDRESFQGILGDFQRHLPLQNEPNLVGHLEYIYLHCLGCVGPLKMWLRRALAVALKDHESRPFGSYMEATVLPRRKLQRMAKELEWGEAALKRLDGDESTIRMVLGMMPTETPLPTISRGMDEGKNENNTHSHSNEKSRDRTENQLAEQPQIIAMRSEQGRQHHRRPFKQRPKRRLLGSTK
jgi:hypothetical protein